MPRLNYGNVVGTIALFVALGGTSYAVTQLPRNSVGPKQLKRNAVTGAKVRDGSLGLKDLGPAARSPGPRGPRGEQGPAGPGLAAPDAWKSLPYASGWTAWGGSHLVGGYRKDQLGTVRLRGLVTKVSGIPSRNDVIGTLPEGYRPQSLHIFGVLTGSPDSIGRVEVYSNGNISWFSGATGEQDHTSLSGITFSTD